MLNLSQSMISLTPRCPALDSADNSTTSIKALHSNSVIEEELAVSKLVRRKETREFENLENLGILRKLTFHEENIQQDINN